MCGIIGYYGNKEITPILLNGLQRLEYRGYDSAGIALMDSNGIYTKNFDCKNTQNQSKSNASLQNYNI